MSKPLVQNAADPEQVKKAGLKESSKRQQELNDLCWVLSTPQGRRFVWRLLGICNIFKWCADNFDEGARRIGLTLLRDVNDGLPDAYVQMLNEANKEEQTNG